MYIFLSHHHWCAQPNWLQFLWFMTCCAEDDAPVLTTTGKQSNKQSMHKVAKSWHVIQPSHWSCIKSAKAFTIYTMFNTFFTCWRIAHTNLNSGVSIENCGVTGNLVSCSVRHVNSTVVAVICQQSLHGWSLCICKKGRWKTHATIHAKHSR